MYLADIPKAMQSIEETVRHIHSLKTRSAPVWTSPFTPETGSDPESYEGKMFPMGFRRLSDSFWILDVLISGDIAETSDPDAPPDRSALARVSYDLSENWTAQIEMIDATSISPDDTNLIPQGSHRLAGSVFFFSTDKSDFPLVVGKFDDGNGNGTGWTRLSLPEELWTTESADGIPGPAEDTKRLRSTPAIFYELTGQLYIGHPQGFEIIQY